MSRDKSWMEKDRASVEWQSGMKSFLEFSFDGAHPNSSVPCPCTKCLNNAQRKRREVHMHLLQNGMDPTYTNWIYHGEHPYEDNMAEDSDDEDAADDGSRDTPRRRRRGHDRAVAQPQRPWAQFFQAGEAATT